MASNLGRIATDDGQYTAATAEGRLYRWFRENTGEWISGVVMDVTRFEEHRCRNASTRKSGINQQVNPAVEWIAHRRLKDRHSYRHVFTHGHWPSDAAKRIGEIAKGEGYPVRGLGVVVPEGRRRQRWRKVKPAAAPAREKVTGPGFLFPPGIRR